ncbi:MAG: hypothetical protein U1E39_15220 [Planctomycetota bacterium]
MSRRPPLRAVALAAGLAALVAARVGGAPGRGEAAAAPARARPEHVVLVVLGGGVRTEEMLGRPDLMPTVREIGRAGVVSDGWEAGGADPVDATEAILTGRDVPATTPNPTRPSWPTVLEYARKGTPDPRAVWFASYADGEALDLAASGHADFGAAAAPSVAVGDGPFGEPMKGLFARFGRPNPTPARALALLDAMRDATAAARRGAPAVPAAAAAEERRLERALLEEVDRRATGLSGPAGLDARALRAGLAVLKVFRPRLLVVRLGQADVAMKDLYGYWDVLKRDDAELARLRREIAADPALATTTTLIVVADLGRDAAQNAAGGFSRGDGSASQRTVALVAEGAGVRAGAVARAPRATRDLCPTIGRLLGVPTPFAEGRVRDDLFVVE